MNEELKKHMREAWELAGRLAEQDGETREQCEIFDDAVAEVRDDTEDEDE